MFPDVSYKSNVATFGKRVSGGEGAFLDGKREFLDFLRISAQRSPLDLKAEKERVSAIYEDGKRASFEKELKRMPFFKKYKSASDVAMFYIGYMFACDEFSAMIF